MDERPTDQPAADASAPQPPVPRIGEHGEPVYDQEFFLALARCGKEVWNRWREGNQNIAVILNFVDFREEEGAISFSEFCFGDGADLSAAVFGAGTDFSKASFGNNANFSFVVFEDEANLAEIRFEAKAKFTSARFGDGVNFSNASLGNDADLSRATFGDTADLAGMTFGDEANLVGVTFGDNVNLSGATFGRHADFYRATFGENANLSGASFGRGADFRAATFGHEAAFLDAIFEGFVLFSNAAFDGTTDFRGAAFGYASDFSEVKFGGGVDFRARSMDEWKQSRRQIISGSTALQNWPEKRKDDFLTFREAPQNDGVRPDAFPYVTFSNACFVDYAHFSGRKFKNWCDLTGGRFLEPPAFDSCEDLDWLDLYGAKITFAGWEISRSHWLSFLTRHLEFATWRTPGWTTESNVGNQLRRLRNLAEITKNHDLERDLFIEERKAERGILLAHHWRQGWRVLLKPELYGHCLWIAVMGWYWLLADYGRSFVRPFMALVVSVPLFWWAYSGTLIPPIDRTKLADFRRATWAFAISNAVPFVGALTLERDVKLTLLCGDRPIDVQQAQASGQPLCVPVPGRRFQLLALAQSIFSALCIFFAGLALRNYFKLR